MTLTELIDKADAVLVNFWKELKTRQDSYFAKHGKYFQLLVSPEQAVIDGADSDFIVRHPSDVKSLEDISIAFTSKIPFQIQVDEWVGADKGYTAYVTVELPNGDIYKRSRNSRNEDSDWFKYVPFPIIQT